LHVEIDDQLQATEAPAGVSKNGGRFVSNPEARKKIADLTLTLNKISEAIKVLSRVTEAISAWLPFAGGRTSSLMPVAQFNAFEKLDQPIMQAGGEAEASKLWHQLSDERDRYLDGVDTEPIGRAKSGGIDKSSGGPDLMAQVVKKRKSISPIFENAIDSLRIGMEFFRRDSSYSSHKHAILTVYHAIELLLKEQLHRINPVLIYKNIDKKVTDDSFTVGLADAITRLENIGNQFPGDQRAIVEKIQGRRNRIEHHRYDRKDAEDEIIIAEALKFIFYFAEFILDASWKTTSTTSFWSQ
jgi:hypothetical protein